MISNRIKFLAVGIALVGAASFAYACDGHKASSKSASASLVSSEGAGSSSQSATKVASGDACAAKGAKGATSASLAGADGCCAKGAKSTMAMAYGKNSVTAAGACPAKNEADYSFYVAGAECKSTGAAVAQTVKSVKGVSSVTVDYENHMVYVCADGKTASKKTIEKSLKTAGYDEVKFVSTSKNNCSKSHGKVEA